MNFGLVNLSEIFNAFLACEVAFLLERMKNMIAYLSIMSMDLKTRLAVKVIFKIKIIQIFEGQDFH